ncbi:hypothetical protein [Fodinicola feengrottensis]|uniref:hypothetical protein n=1 Tax=Fodinicola feengrottensis TaxID=435914 RepID=UPI00244359F2|nr:hypothetical protein [Fodinicola feengrottensis]
MTTDLTVGVGVDAAEFDGGQDMVLNIGPQHPATHGVLRLRLILDGERIRTAEPIIGYMHRGAEKLFEARDYRQIIMLANRHDWLSAFCNELGGWCWWSSGCSASRCRSARSGCERCSPSSTGC